MYEKAWEIIERRRAAPVGTDGRIFPYDRENVSVRHVTAVKVLSDGGKVNGSSLRFHDYRFEAAHRLLELGIPSEQVARATGQPPARIFSIAQAKGEAAREAAVSRSDEHTEIAEETTD